MKFRSLSTKFWSDDFVVNINPLDRYLFLYLLTNEHANICGVYELSTSVISRETGIESDTISKMMSRLEPKVLRHGVYLILPNTLKHQSPSPSINTAILREIENIPYDVFKNILEICPNISELFASRGISHPRAYTIPTPSLHPVDSVVAPHRDIDSNRDKDSDKNILRPEGASKNTKVSVLDGSNKSPVHPQIIEVIGIFRIKNPNAQDFYANITQRRAIEKLLAEYGYETVMNMAMLAVTVQGLEFAPVVTTPLDLYKKWAALRAYGEREQGKINKGSDSVAIVS